MSFIVLCIFMASSCNYGEKGLLFAFLGPLIMFEQFEGEGGLYCTMRVISGAINV